MQTAIFDVNAVLKDVAAFDRAIAGSAVGGIGKRKPPAVRCVTLRQGAG